MSKKNMLWIGGIAAVVLVVYMIKKSKDSAAVSAMKEKELQTPGTTPAGTATTGMPASIAVGEIPASNEKVFNSPSIIDAQKVV